MLCACVSMHVQGHMCLWETHSERQVPGFNPKSSDRPCSKVAFIPLVNCELGHSKRKYLKGEHDPLLYLLRKKKRKIPLERGGNSP